MPRGRVTALLTPSIVPADLLRAFEPILPDRKYTAKNIEFVCGDSCVEIHIEPVIRGETIERVPEPYIGAVQHLPELSPTAAKCRLSYKPARAVSRARPAGYWPQNRPLLPAVSQPSCDRSGILENRHGHGIFFSFTCLSVGVGRYSCDRETLMKWNSVAAVLALALTAGIMSSTVNAAGCLKGAAVGGVAGHVAGHHGVLGAGAGCVIGHHQANKHARQQATQNPGSGNNAAGTGGGSDTSR
jgi:hypothetical protein